MKKADRRVNRSFLVFCFVLSVLVDMKAKMSLEMDRTNEVLLPIRID